MLFFSLAHQMHWSFIGINMLCELPTCQGELSLSSLLGR